MSSRVESLGQSVAYLEQRMLNFDMLTTNATSEKKTLAR